MTLGIYLGAMEGLCMADKNYKYTKKYDKENTVNISLKLNINTDADIIEYLKQSENKQGTIKQLIRNEINRGN